MKVWKKEKKEILHRKEIWIQSRRKRRKSSVKMQCRGKIGGGGRVRKMRKKDGSVRQKGKGERCILQGRKGKK